MIQVYSLVVEGQIYREGLVCQTKIGPAAPSTQPKLIQNMVFRTLLTIELHTILEGPQHCYFSLRVLKQAQKNCSDETKCTVV